MSQTRRPTPAPNGVSDIDDYYADGDYTYDCARDHGFSGAGGLLAIPLRNHGSGRRE
jgi:hypothetical protein